LHSSKIYVAYVMGLGGID